MRMYKCRPSYQSSGEEAIDCGRCSQYPGHVADDNTTEKLRNT